MPPNGHYDYASIKAMARERGISPRELIALAPQNDPFYAGTPADLEQSHWFRDMWDAAGLQPGTHLRRMHYRLVSQDPPPDLPGHRGPYVNTERCWGLLALASKKARYLGLIAVGDIADHKHPAPHIYADYSLDQVTPTASVYVPDLTNPYVSIAGINNATAQPYHLELWIEKSTINDELKPLAARYNANLATFEGEVSITACKNLIQRVKASGGKPARIFYISDFDPAGNSMPIATSRKIEWLLYQQRQLDFDIRLKPIILTAGQVAEYHLPRMPIKETERRANRFEALYGPGAVELDALTALHPGTLEDIVEAELLTYTSAAAREAVRTQTAALQAAMNARIEAITGRYSAEIAAIEAMLQELRELTIDADTYVVDRYPPHVSELEPDWLYASDRDYMTQLYHYKTRQNGTNGGQP